MSEVVVESSQGRNGKTTTLTFGQTYKHISSDLLSVTAMSDCLLFCARGEERRGGER